MIAQDRSSTLLPSIRQLDAVHDLTQHDQSWFDYKYQDKLGYRHGTFRRALQELAQNSSSSRICVETGCVRSINDYSAGYSTYIIGEFIAWYGGELHTVDITPKHIALCKKVTKKFSEVITYYVEDSVQFLAAWPENKIGEKIDFLYLDSYDYPGAPREGSIALPQEHCLAELKAALPSLHHKSIVLIDDGRLPGGGKPGLAKHFMAELGWTCLLDDYQTLWRVE